LTASDKFCFREFDPEAFSSRFDGFKIPFSEKGGHTHRLRRKPLTETQRHGEKFPTGTLTPSSASATLCNDFTETPPNPMRQNAGDPFLLGHAERASRNTFTGLV
jgi:hypothetical protein